MQRKKTTSEAAPSVGLDHKILLNYILRYPELRPAERLPGGDYMWGEDDIQRVIDFRDSKRRIKT